MSNTINSRTPEDIKKGLEYCQTSMTTKYKVCSKCAYFDDGYECENVLRQDALDYIQQLEREKEELVKNKLLDEGTTLDLREVVKVCEGELLVAAINMISDMQAAAPKWISVKERLPDIENENGMAKCTETVIGVDKLGYQYVGFFMVYKYDNSFEFVGCDCNGFDRGKFDITHWMLLPEVPKEEE